ncbi:MAG: heme NO-binding domain-containing protein, partial [Rubrivivax sp.]
QPAPGGWGTPFARGGLHMKGMVFTEFLDYVRQHHGDDMVDDIIDDSDLASGGAYTAVGIYHHGEMFALCTALAARTGQAVPVVVRGFGDHLSGTFARSHPAFFARAGNLFDFLESIEGHIHVEVRKLYPDAALPSFRVEARTPTRIVLLYRSPRRMGHLSEGLIQGSARQFGVQVLVESEVLANSDSHAVRFTVDLV